MKRIGALSGMKGLMLVLVFQTGYTAAGATQEVEDATPPIEDAPVSYWTGRIEQDTMWRDTVYVSGDVTIASGATLTLAPDTSVHFLPYHDDTQGGLDSTRAELIVEGRLYAQAGAIVFGSADAGSLGAVWYGIVIRRGGLADVSNAMIRDGLRCLYTKRGGRVRMDHIAFANCGIEPKPPGRGFDDFNVDDHTVHRPTKTPSQRSTDQETTSMTGQIISKLIMGDFSHSVSSARDSTQIDSGYAKASDQDSGRGKWIAGQLIVGTFIAVVIFYMFSGFFFGVPSLIWVILVPLMPAL